MMPTYTVQAVLTMELEADTEDAAVQRMYEVLLRRPSAEDFTIDVLHQVRQP